MFSVQLMPEKVTKFIQIKEPLSTEHRAGNVLSVQLLLEKVLKLNQIKKAQKVQDNCSLLKTVNGQVVYH